MFIAFFMALVDVVLLILTICFFAKERKHPKEKYLCSLVPVAAEESVESDAQTEGTPVAEDDPR